MEGNHTPAHLETTPVGRANSRAATWSPPSRTFKHPSSNWDPAKPKSRPHEAPHNPFSSTNPKPTTHGPSESPARLKESRGARHNRNGQQPEASGEREPSLRAKNPHQTNVRRRKKRGGQKENHPLKPKQAQAFTKHSIIRIEETQVIPINVVLEVVMRNAQICRPLVHTEENPSRRIVVASAESEAVVFRKDPPRGRRGRNG